MDSDGDGICDNFIDEDGDGICDHCTGDQVRNRHRRAQGSGNNYGNAGSSECSGGCRNGSQQNFIDRDGDGICDNYLTRPLVERPYPNPFTTSTTLEFTLQAEANVKLAVYDISGNLIELLYEGTLAAGEHSYTFTAEGIEPGRYFFVLKINDNFTFTRQIVYVN